MSADTGEIMDKWPNQPDSLSQIAEDLQFLIWHHNNDERHVYPDPCQVCEMLEDFHKIYDRLKAIEGE